jgi:hypothetical protein
MSQSDTNYFLDKYTERLCLCSSFGLMLLLSRVNRCLWKTAGHASPRSPVQQKRLRGYWEKEGRDETGGTAPHSQK